MTGTEEARALLAAFHDPNFPDAASELTYTDFMDQWEVGPAEFFCAAPRLVAALADTLEAVAALHVSDEDTDCSCDVDPLCVECDQFWPCPTARLVNPDVAS